MKNTRMLLRKGRRRIADTDMIPMQRGALGLSPIVPSARSRRPLNSDRSLLTLRQLTNTPALVTRRHMLWRFSVSGRSPCLRESMVEVHTVQIEDLR